MGTGSLTSLRDHSPKSREQASYLAAAGKAVREERRGRRFDNENDGALVLSRNAGLKNVEIGQIFLAC